MPSVRLRRVVPLPTDGKDCWLSHNGQAALRPVPSAFADRSPPYSPEAERAVLAGMFLDPQALLAAVEIVDETMFFREEHRRLFRALVAVWQRGDVVDEITVGEQLRQAAGFSENETLPFLGRLLDATPTAANIEYHCKIVREKAILRRLIEAATGIIQSAYSAEAEPLDLIGDARAALDAVGDQADRGGGLVWVKDVLWPTFERIEQVQDNPGGLAGVSTGFADLDELTAGLQDTDLIILAARPSMGKSAMALAIALHVSIAKQRPVAYFSPEMSKEQLVQRALCMEARVDAGRMKRGKLLDDEYARLAIAAGHLNTAPLYIDETRGINLQQVRARARRFKSDRGDLGLLVADYLTKFKLGSKAENRYREVSDIAGSFRNIAGELGVPGLVLCQLSRAVESRPDKRPMMSDLRDSGEIEEHADVIMFLYRPEYYFGPVDKAGNSIEGNADLIVAKQRSGATGTVPLFFRKEYTLFESVMPSFFGER